VQQCVNVGLVQGERLSVDGTVIAADASSKSRVSREQLPEAAKVSRTLREYFAEVETANPTPSSENQTPPEDSGKISSSDPDATWTTKGGVPAQLSYYDNYLIDNESNIILDVEATPACFSQEVAAARTMVERVEATFAIEPQSLGADKAYGSGEFLAWLLDRNIAPHIRVIDRTRQNAEFFTRDFVFEPEINAYRCPASKLLTYRGIGRASRVYTYNASPKDCAECPLKSRCTAGRGRRLVVNFDEPARQRTKELCGTEAYWRSWRERKKVEVLFAELKTVIKLRRFRLRRLWNVAEQTLMAATAQNIRRLISFLATPAPEPA